MDSLSFSIGTKKKILYKIVRTGLKNIFCDLFSLRIVIHIENIKENEKELRIIRL